MNNSSFMVLAVVATLLSSALTISAQESQSADDRLRMRSTDGAGVITTETMRATLLDPDKPETAQFVFDRGTNPTNPCGKVLSLTPSQMGNPPAGSRAYFTKCSNGEAYLLTQDEKGGVMPQKLVQKTDAELAARRPASMGARVFTLLLVLLLVGGLGYGVVRIMRRYR